MDDTKRNHEEHQDEKELLIKKIDYLLKINSNLEQWNEELRKRLKYLRYKGFEYTEGLELNTKDFYRSHIRKKLIELLPENTLNPVINRLTEIMLLFMVADEVKGSTIKSSHEISRPTYARDMVLIQKTGLVELKDGYRKKSVFVLTRTGKEFQNELIDKIDNSLKSIT